MINIKISASLLCELCAPHFSFDACEAICDFLEECGTEEPMMIGDICIGFTECPESWRDEFDEESIIAELPNGNFLAIQ